MNDSSPIAIELGSIRNFRETQDLWCSEFAQFGYGEAFFEDLFFSVDYRTYVAHDNGRVLGVGVFREEAGEGELVGLAVKMVFRRSGLGSSLLIKIVRELERTGVRRCILHTQGSNTAAIRFFERHGFSFEAIEGKYSTGEVALRFALRISRDRDALRQN